MTLNSRRMGQQGFTLVEIMISMAIVGIGVLIVASLMTSNMRQSKDMSNTQSYNQLKGGVMDASAQAEALSKSEALQFQNLGVTPTPIP